MSGTGVHDAQRTRAGGRGVGRARAVSAIVAHLSAAVRGFTAAGDSRGGDDVRATGGRVLEPDGELHGWPGVVRAAPGVWSATSRRASSRAGWRWPRWGARCPTLPNCSPIPSSHSNGRASSAMSTSRPRRSPTAGSPMSRPAGWRRWRCSTRRWRWPGGPPTTRVRRPSRCARSSPRYVSGDFERAGTWTDLLADRGLMAHDNRQGAFLSGHCDSVRAALMVEMGWWSDAEATLVAPQRASSR